MGTGGAATDGEQGSGGSGGGEASCSDVTPCGGDVVGSWGVTSSCLTVSGVLDVSGVGLSCSSVPIAGVLQVTGTWTANADGTYSDNTTTSGEEQFELSASCLANLPTTSCPRLGGPLESLGFASVTCTGSLDVACTCSATVDQAGGIGVVASNASASGTYATSDAVLTTSPGDGHSYCVSGNTLTLAPRSAGTTGAVVFQRQ
jgi:hypothetical protein